MTNVRPLTMVALLALIPLPATATAAGPGSLGGIGVLGDSYSDEYACYPPDRSTARNWVEILAATRGLDFGAYSTAGRGEPRNQGYAYNWARSDATSDDLIAAGQHLGVAGQVARGEVRLVAVFIGGNDFIHALKSPDPAGALRAVAPRVSANLRAAIRTVRAADPGVRLVLVALPDIRNLPEFAGPIGEGRIPGDLADAYTAAIRDYNSQMWSLAAADPRTALLDLDLPMRLANRTRRDYIGVAGRKLDRRRPGNGLDHFFLADVRHVGTLGQGLIAQMFIDTIDAKFAAGIQPLSGPELLGLAESLQGPGPTPAPAAGTLAVRGASAP